MVASCTSRSCNSWTRRLWSTKIALVNIKIIGDLIQKGKQCKALHDLPKVRLSSFLSGQVQPVRLDGIYSNTIYLPLVQIWTTNSWATKSIKAIASLWLHQFTLNDWNCSSILLSPLRLTRVWRLHGIEWLTGRARSWNLLNSILSSDILKSKSFQILVVMFFFIFLLRRYMVWLGIDAPKWSDLNSGLNCCTFVPRYK